MDLARVVPLTLETSERWLGNHEELVVGIEKLNRDIGNLCKYFARGGARADPASIADSLWRRRMRGAL